MRESRVEAERGPLHERHVEREVKDGPPSEAGRGTTLEEIANSRLLQQVVGCRFDQLCGVFPTCSQNAPSSLASPQAISDSVMSADVEWSACAVMWSAGDP